MPNELLTLREVCALARISLVTLYRLRSAGQGPRHVTVGRRMVRFRRSDVERWLSGLRSHEGTLPPR